VHSQAYHFWDGPGRRGAVETEDPNNFYENYAEDTKGKKRIAVPNAEIA
jgi:6-phosphofructo-2-kinase / fructose-2,6-biphosphatase 4